MNRRTLRATGIVLTGMLLAGDPVSMIYAAPVAGVSVATTAEAVAVGTGSSSPSAGVSLAVADCLVASNEEVAQEAAAQQGAFAAAGRTDYGNHFAFVYFQVDAFEYFQIVEFFPDIGCFDFCCHSCYSSYWSYLEKRFSRRSKTRVKIRVASR